MVFSLTQRLRLVEGVEGLTAGQGGYAHALNSASFPQ
jgi:hypothetical protein